MASIALRLAFGEEKAIKYRSALKAAEAAKSVFPSLVYFEANDARRFHCTQSVVDANGLVLLANTCSAGFARVRNLRYGHLHFQMAGRGKFYVDGRTLLGQAKRSAVFLPEGCSYDHEFSEQSSVVARIDQSRLWDTARTMLGGLENSDLLTNLQNPKSIQLNLNGLSFDGVLRLLFSQLDCYSHHTRILDISGLDDMFYRTVVAAIMPEAFERQTTSQVNSLRKHRLDRVCKYILANLSGRITLSNLERIAYVSKKTLNTLFSRHLGITPKGWVLEQRLLRARALLNKRNQDRSISEIFEDCGFRNASSFSFQYKRRFGESPSTTLSRSRGRIF